MMKMRTKKGVTFSLLTLMQLLLLPAATALALAASVYSCLNTFFLCLSRYPFRTLVEMGER